MAVLGSIRPRHVAEQVKRVPRAWASEGVFPEGGSEVDFSKGSQKDFFRRGPKVMKFHFT